MADYQSFGEIHLDLSRSERADAAGQRVKAVELRLKLHLDKGAGQIEGLCKGRYGVFSVETVNRLCGEVCAANDRSDYEVKQLPPQEFIRLAKLLPPPVSATPRMAQDEAIWRGNGRVQVGDSTITLEPQLAEVLQALVELRSATKPQLQEKSGRDDPDKLLKKLVKRFPSLVPHIRFPGGRGRGGYSTTIGVTPD